MISGGRVEGTQKRLTVCLFFFQFIGAANIVDKNAEAPRTDKEVVPPEAVRPSMENSDYHVGRGGAGNEHHAEQKDGAAATAAAAGHKEGPKGLADKLKAKVTGLFKK